MTTPPNPLQDVPSHIHTLLNRLHAESLAQETALPADAFQASNFHEVMRDKFIALDQDKCHFIYQLCRSINAKTIVEAGTSYGVSTIYLALAVAANVAATGGKGTVVGTEYEANKAEQARAYWRECGGVVEDLIDLREGDLRETLKEDVAEVDLLLLDIWTPMALPTLQLIQPKMRYGAIVIADNTVKSGVKYKELLDYLRAPQSGFTNLTLPYSNGLEMSVYLPQGQ
ncbi:hypothetical protein FE257_002505 [Aspergillus nanangensis]|uniref:O-methyltransferase n=1 Tax=Aspergillus nanangensis TaxID=2582783 RepID=A0AAD4CSW5_ASPNN|nr:hypothetical protein FE257_002505 [Aspergillus nanangensis]